MYVGIDWAAETHAICVLDDAGHTLSTFTMAHTAEGFERLTSRLRRLGDAGDALVIAEYLRLRQHRLRTLTPFSPQTRALRAVVRTRTDLVDQRVTATNQLAACLEAFWLGAKVIFADIERPIALDFLTRYPTPEAAARLGEARMRAFCTKHGYAGLALVGVLRALNTAIKDLDRSVTAHLGEHPDAEIFTSLPRSSRINAAQVLAEWGDCRPAYSGPDAGAALAGAAPVTKHSGKHHAVHFRWACNKRFRTAITTFADNSRHASPRAANVYADALARGCDHPHAIRVLARAWIRVIWRRWVDQISYDPSRHGNARKLSEPAMNAA